MMQEPDGIGGLYERASGAIRSQNCAAEFEALKRQGRRGGARFLSYQARRSTVKPLNVYSNTPSMYMAMAFYSTILSLQTLDLFC